MVPWLITVVATGPRPTDRWLSMTLASSKPSGSARRSSISATSRIISSRSSTPSLLIAEMGTVTVSPPQSSGVKPRWARSFITFFKSAFGLSILLIATIIGMSAARMWSIASTVCAIIPSSAAITNMAMSVAIAPRARIPVNALCPGVSIKVILWPCRSAWYAPTV